MAAAQTDLSQVKVNRWTRTSLIGSPVALLVILLMFALPYITALSNIRALTDLLIFIIIGSMWNLMAGYGGMESVGQQAYIGLGAYGFVVIADLLGINVFLAIPLAGIVAGVIAFLLSFLAFRLVAPLLQETQAISDYILLTQRLDLRSALPEVNSVNEAVMLASTEYRLTPSQQKKLTQLLKDLMSGR